LEEGTFFTPFDVIWDDDVVDARECNGYFEKICREQDYFKRLEPYREIVEQIQNERESKETGLNHVQAALHDMNLSRVSFNRRIQP